MRKIGLILYLSGLISMVNAQVETFDFVIKTTTPDTDFKFQVDGAQQFKIIWGDNSPIEELKNGNQLVTHLYKQPGTYTNRVNGTATRIAFGHSGATPELLVDITSSLNSGVTGIVSTRQMFSRATNITAFSCATWFDDASRNVRDMSYMFTNAKNFNQCLNNWSVEQVTNMREMFHRAEGFNGNISNWSVSQVVDMQDMFRAARVFNQNISGWDVSSVTNMSQMFWYAQNFNSNISKWQVNKVRNMDQMFRETRVFDQDISEWQVGSVESFSNFLNQAENFSMKNYNLLWNKWSQQTLQQGVRFDAGKLKHALGEPAKQRQQVIDKFGWIIRDGGVASINIPDNAIRDGWLDARACGASGSDFTTTATTQAGSNKVVLQDVGDFQIGQGIMLSKANIRYLPIKLWGQGVPNMNSRPLNNSVEVRGYDGSTGNWVVYYLDIKPSPGAKPRFRWTSDFARTWHPEQEITHDWQPLEAGIEVRLNQRDWEAGYVIAIGMRDQLITTIERIEGKTLYLKKAANQSTTDAVVHHNDTTALQEAINYAIKNKLNVHIPVGHYRLANRLQVRNPAGIVIEGASAVDTLLDISEGEGSCFHLMGGVEATIRNFRMVGFWGFENRDMAGGLRMLGAPSIWGFAVKHCNAMTINNTERVLVENCHASHMSGECFVACGRSRGKAGPGFPYTKKITYLRCSVTDSARNAFNDQVCGLENTDILHCRIDNVGGCSWEGASRFVTFAGNYVRNGGTVAIGNLGLANRDETYPDLGAGQTIVADNIFEQGVCYGGCAIRTSRGATQVIIRNNLFINFGSSAIAAAGNSFGDAYPAANTIITGNIMDMSAIGQDSVPRVAIDVAASDTIVSDNQIYTRNTSGVDVAAIKIAEPVLNIMVHNNMIRNCKFGIACTASANTISKLHNNAEFTLNSWGGITLGRQPHGYQGWLATFYRSNQIVHHSEVEHYTPVEARFKLKKGGDIKRGDRVNLSTDSTNWSINNNMIISCLTPILLDAHGSQSAYINNNVITRGSATGASEAIKRVRGEFQVENNRVTGF